MRDKYFSSSRSDFRRSENERIQIRNVFWKNLFDLFEKRFDRFELVPIDDILVLHDAVQRSEQIRREKFIAERRKDFSFFFRVSRRTFSIFRRGKIILATNLNRFLERIRARKFRRSTPILNVRRPTARNDENLPKKSFSRCLELRFPFDEKKTREFLAMNEEKSLIFFYVRQRKIKNLTARNFWSILIENKENFSSGEISNFFSTFSVTNLCESSYRRAKSTDSDRLIFQLKAKRETKIFQTKNENEMFSLLVTNGIDVKFQRNILKTNRFSIRWLREFSFRFLPDRVRSVSDDEGFAMKFYRWFRVEPNFSNERRFLFCSHFVSTFFFNSKEKIQSA